MCFTLTAHHLDQPRDKGSVWAVATVLDSKAHESDLDGLGAAEGATLGWIKSVKSTSQTPMLQTKYGDEVTSGLNSCL